MERDDLSAKAPGVVKALAATLKAVIDYPAVALDVADYNQKMFKWYMQGGYSAHVGGNAKHDYTSWQQAVVGLPGGGREGLPGGPSGGAWGGGGQWGTSAAALAALKK